MAIAVTSTQRWMYTTRHQDKSELELQITLSELQQQIVMLPNTPASTPYLEELAAECQVCADLLEQKRKAEQTRINKAKSWLQEQEAGTDKYLENLMAAISPNGQLVAAILEEMGGMTAKEIQTWCEELESLEDQEFQNLIEELEKEEIILQKDGRYYLNQLCEEGLKPVFGVGEKWKWSNFTPEERLVLDAVREYNIIMSAFTDDIQYYSKDPEHHIKTFLDAIDKSRDILLKQLELDEFPEIPSEEEIENILNRLIYTKKALVKEKGIVCLPTLGKKG